MHSRLLLPLEDATLAPSAEEARRRSHAGFIAAAGETMEGVVRADAALLELLGDTAEAQGRWLRALLRAVDATGWPAGSVRALGPDSESGEARLPRPLVFAPCRAEGDGAVEFERIDALGDQWSPMAGEEDVRWRREYVLRRPRCTADDGVRCAVEVRVGGHAEAGVARWIEERGFYEGGGVGNPYRVDPRALRALRTGHVASSYLCDRRAYFSDVLRPMLERDVAAAVADVGGLSEQDRAAFRGYVEAARLRLRRAAEEYHCDL